MKYLIIFAFISTACSAMFSISQKARSLPVRRYSTRAVGSHDAVAAAMHELGAHMKHLEAPIESGIHGSSWFNDRISGYPEYLTTYGKYFKPIQALHCINLMALQPALVTSKPRALGDWVTVCSINSAGMGMPEAASKLVRIYYLDLLVLANKLSASQKQALSTVIEARMSYIHGRHLVEMYGKFTKEYHSIEDPGRRSEILKAAENDFLLIIMDTGMNRTVRAIRKHIPIMAQDSELISAALKLWKLSMNRIFKRGERIDDRVGHTYILYINMVRNSILVPEEKEALSSAARFLSAYMVGMEEIFDFVRLSDRTVNNQAKQRLSALLPFDE